MTKTTDTNFQKGGLMLLIDILGKLKLERDIEQITYDQYERSVRRYDAYLKRASTTDDLEPDQLNNWLIWLGQTYGLGPQSIVNYRTGIVRVWNYATELGIAPACPVRRIRRPKQPQRIVSAWSLEQFAILLEATARLPGYIRGTIKSSVFMHAWLWLAYETGFRPTDLRLLRWDLVDWDNQCVQIIQHKTGGIHTARIGPESIAALKALQGHGYPQIFPCGKSGIYRWEQILFREAGKNGFTRAKKQGCGTLRKTHATEIYRHHGLAAAAESLGHRGDVSTARRHYIASDARAGLLPPSPPRRTG